VTAQTAGAGTTTVTRGTPVRQKIRLLTLYLMVLTFPILMNYFSVYLIIEGSSLGIMTFSFFFWSAWTVSALFLGRAGCGYLCPLGALQETKDRMAPRKLSTTRRLRVTKYLLAVAWVGAIVGSAVAAGGYKGVGLLYKIDSGVSVDSAQGWFMYGTIVLVTLLPVFFLGKRGFCHFFCPWGVLNTVGTKIKNAFRWPSLHLVPETGQCKGCKTCNRNCPMSLDVNSMVQKGSMQDNECILCGTCVDNCPKGVIKYSWGRPQRQTGN